MIKSILPDRGVRKYFRSLISVNDSNLPIKLCHIILSVKQEDKSYWSWLKGCFSAKAMEEKMIKNMSAKKLGFMSQIYKKLIAKMK